MSPVESPAAVSRAQRAASAKHRAARRSRADRRAGYLFVAPVVIVLLAITGYPLVYNVWNSVHHVNLSVAHSSHRYVGAANYTKMFTSPAWVSALERTAGFAAASAVIDVAVGLGLALMIHRQFRGRGLLRASILIPWAVPTVVSATLWKSMFDPRAGFVDYLLGQLHLPGSTTTWLAHTPTAWVAIFVADAWRNVPFVAIILLAGLQVIPGEVYEAARIDGATVWQSFRRMTVPLLKPALAVALIFRTLQAFLVFDVIYIMTGGGPGTSTETLSFVNWQTFLVNTDFGYGGAQSVVLVVFALAIAGTYVRVFRTQA